MNVLYAEVVGVDRMVATNDCEDITKGDRLVVSNCRQPIGSRWRVPLDRVLAFEKLAS